MGAADGGLLAQLSEAGFEPRLIRDEVASGTTGLSTNFATFVAKMCSEIGALLDTDERVHVPDPASGDLTGFKMELSSFLKEVNCPLAVFLVDGKSIQDRFSSPNHRRALLDYLLTALLDARMAALGGDSSKSDGVHCLESPTAKHLTAVLRTLGLSDPPFGVSPAQFFKQILAVLAEPAKREALLSSGPLFAGGALNDSQWQALHSIASDMEREFVMRRTVLITRLSATIQSFTWSEKAKRLPREAMEAVKMEAFRTAAFTHVTVADVLAAREDLTTVTKVSSVPPSTRVKNSLTKVKVGRVPDRGGRPSEQEAPPPEMPSWQQRSAGPPQGGGGRGGGGYQRGGGHNQGYAGGGQNQGHGGGGHNKGHGGGGGHNQGYGGGHNQGHRGDGGHNQGYGGGGHNQGYGGGGNNQGYRGGGHNQDYGGGQNQGYGGGGGHNQGYQGNRGDGGHRGGNRGGGNNRDRHRGVQGSGWKRN